MLKYYTSVNVIGWLGCYTVSGIGLSQSQFDWLRGNLSGPIWTRSRTFSQRELCCSILWIYQKVVIGHAWEM